jgi:hypothetical protein
MIMGAACPCPGDSAVKADVKKVVNVHIFRCRLPAGCQSDQTACPLQRLHGTNEAGRAQAEFACVVAILLGIGHPLHIMNVERA